MFTGLVAETGKVRALERSPRGTALEVETALAGQLREGDSVAVQGVCLTAVSIRDGVFRADVIAETLARSSLGRLRPGDRVNLELPLRPADRLGGHVVQGHVDGIGTVESIWEEGFSRRLTIFAEPRLCRYLVEKGSVALDGVSLTVADADEDRFELALIPETTTRTTLGELSPGDLVNIEVDLLAKYVERLAGRATGAPVVGTGP